MPGLRKPKPKPAHVKGKYLGVALINPVSELPLPSYQAKDGSRVYVQAMNGQTYGIQVENYARRYIIYKVEVDGLAIADFFLEPYETDQVMEVCTGIEEHPDGTTRETYRPLMFSQPRVIPSWQPSDTHTADKGTVHEQLDKLGKVVVEVWRAVKTEPGPVVQPVVGEEEMSVEVSEGIDRSSLKNAVFAVHTALTADEEVVIRSEPETSTFEPGEHLETLTFSYGTEAALRKEMPGVMLKKKRGWVEVYGFDPKEVTKKPAKQSGGKGKKRG